jgi:signal transduction histidine kinase
LLVRHKLKNQSILLDRKLEADLPLLMGDAAQLEQAFLNLILNAAEAMPKGGKLTIRSRAIHLPRANPKSTHVALDFSDTGHGMSDEQRRKLFSSVLQSGKAKGTGLGLAIVRRIIEAHSGKLRVTSRIGRGTTVRILLPAA